MPSPTSLSLLPLIAEAEVAGVAGQVAALAALYPDTAVATQPWGAGGLLAYAGAGCPLNRGCGLATAGEPPAGLLDQAEAFYDGLGEPAAVACYPDATPRLRDELQRRAYTLTQTLLVHVAALPLSLGGPLPGPMLAEHTDDDDLWVTTAAAGFRGAPVHAGLDDMATRLARASVRPEVRLFLARLEGEPVGAGALWRGAGRTALVFSGSVLPEFRGLGAHRALVHVRLVAAMGEGLPFAMSLAVPDSAAAHNLQRFGFDPMFLRETWVKALG